MRFPAAAEPGPARVRPGPGPGVAAQICKKGTGDKVQSPNAECSQSTFNNGRELQREINAPQLGTIEEAGDWVHLK